MEERLGVMRKGRRKRMRKGANVSSSPQGMTSWSSSIKIWFFLNALLKCHGVKQNAKDIDFNLLHSVHQWYIFRRTKN